MSAVYKNGLHFTRETLAGNESTKSSYVRFPAFSVALSLLATRPSLARMLLFMDFRDVSQLEQYDLVTRRAMWFTDESASFHLTYVTPILSFLMSLSSSRLTCLIFSRKFLPLNSSSMTNICRKTPGKYAAFLSMLINHVNILIIINNNYINNNEGKRTREIYYC